MRKSQKKSAELGIMFTNPTTNKAEEMLVSESYKVIGPGKTKVNMGTIPEEVPIIMQIGKSNGVERNIFVKAKNDLSTEITEKFKLIPFWGTDGFNAKNKRKKGDYVVDPNFLAKATSRKNGDPDFRIKLWRKVTGQEVNLSNDEIAEKLKLYATKDEIVEILGLPAHENETGALNPKNDPREMASS